MARARFAMSLLAVALVVVACGGGGGSSEGGGGSPGGAGGAITSQADQIKGCLQDAGLQPEENPTKAFGVDDPYVRLTIPLHSETFDENYHGDVYVFETDAAALKNRPAITLQSEDDERNQVIGNVLVSFGIIPDKDTAKTVEGCV